MKAKLLLALSWSIFASPAAYADISLPPFQPAMDINIAASIYRQNPSTYDGTDKPHEKSKNLDKADFASALIFKTDKAASKINIQAFSDEHRRMNAATGAELDKLFASQDVLGLIGLEMKKYGLSQNNVADVFAVYWMTLWQVANQDYTDQSTATIQAVAKQSKLAFSATPAFIGISDSAKQQMVEKYLLFSAILGASAAANKSDSQIQASFVSSAKQAALYSGIDLDMVTLTENGFYSKNSLQPEN